MKNIFIIILLIFTTHNALSQDNWTEGKEGELEDAQVVVEKNKELKLPNAQRSLLNIPKVNSEQDSIKVSTNWQEILPVLSTVQPGMRVLRIKSEPLEKIYGNQLTIGFGNYGASHVAGYLSNKRDKSKSYGVQFYHKAYNSGSVDRKYSGSGYQFISPYAKLVSKNVTLKADILYERSNNYDYGLFEAEANLNEQYERKDFQKIYQRVGADVQLEDRNIDNNFDYTYDVHLSHFFTNENGSESLFSYKLNNSYKLNDAIKISLPISGFTSKYSLNELDLNRYLFRIQPGLNFLYDKLEVQAGFNIVGENDQLRRMGKLHVYPMLKANYHVSSKFILKAGLDGDVERVLYQDFMMSNPYIEGQNVVNSVLVPFRLNAGFFANLFNRVTLRGDASIASVLNKSYVQNTLEDSGTEPEFYSNMAYFTDNITQVKASISAGTDLYNFFRLNTSLNYLKYYSEEIDIFPHTPQLRWTLSGGFEIKDKLEVKTSLYAQSETKALLINGLMQESYNINPFIDLGLDFKYNFSDRSAAFLSFNNLIAKEYNYYLNYPGRGFQVMAGFTYSF